MPLFKDSELTLVNVYYCVFAAVCDAAYVLALYWIIAKATHDRAWIYRLTGPRVVAVLAAGFVCAAFVEWFALSTGMWSYNQRMPVLPVLGVGISPLIQLMFLTLATYWLSARLAGRS